MASSDSVGVGRTEALVVDDVPNRRGADIGTPDEAAACDATGSTEGVENVKPLMVERSVDEEDRIEEAIDKVLLADGVFELSATVSAATLVGSLLRAELDAEDDEVGAPAMTATALEAYGYAGTVRSLGKGGTDGTDGRETLGTAGTDGTDGRTTEATVGTAGTDGMDGWISDGRDATDGTSGFDASVAAATGVGTDSGAETSLFFVAGIAGAASVGAVESGCVTVVCATIFPAVSTVATTSTFTVLMLLPLPAWGALRWNRRWELVMIARLFCKGPSAGSVVW